jgi:hypothetical protein
MFQQLLVTNTSRTIMTGVFLLTLTFLFMKIYQGQFENDMESHIFFETQYYFEKKIFEDVFIIEQYQITVDGIDDDHYYQFWFCFGVFSSTLFSFLACLIVGCVTSRRREKRFNLTH